MISTTPPAAASKPPDWARLIILLLSGAVLAIGRYDWGANPTVAFRSLVMSEFFFCLLLLGSYAIARSFALTNRRGFWLLAAGADLLMHLPYRWLGLGRFYYLATHTYNYGVTKNWVPEWLGRDRPAIPWNSTDTLLLGLLIATVIGAWFVRFRTTARHGLLAFFLLLLAFMTVESWLHLSNRSPYSYIAHFEQPDAANHTYTYEMLPDGRARVNADVFYFIRLEELFQGNGAEPPMLLVRRAFPFYVSSHLSYFLGPYHAFLVFNLVLWLAAAAALYFFSLDLTHSVMVARCSAGFVACAPGFIMYAAQPMGYLPGYAMLAITIFLYHRLVVQTRLANVTAIVGAGILLGLTMLTYDTFAWVLFFVGYALLHRVAVLRFLAPIALGAAVYIGFLFLLFHVFTLQPDRDNDRHMGEAIRHVLELFGHPTVARIAPLAKSFFGRFFGQVMQVNFYVPFFLAGIGLLVASNALRLRALTLLLPSLAAFFVLHFGESYLASLARFNYAAYPAVILLAALAVGRLADYWLTQGRTLAAWLTVGLPVAAAAVIGNIDVFGTMPYLYYHFYYSAGGSFN